MICKSLNSNLSMCRSSENVKNKVHFMCISNGNRTLNIQSLIQCTVQYNVIGFLGDSSIHLTNAGTSQYVCVVRGCDLKSVICESLELDNKLREVRPTIQNLQVLQVLKLVEVQEILLWYMFMSKFETFQLWK